MSAAPSRGWNHPSPVRYGSWPDHLWPGACDVYCGPTAFGHAPWDLGAAVPPRARDGYDAYFGTYEIDDTAGTVTQRLLGALSAENVRMVLTRGMQAKDDRLTIRLRTTAAIGEPVTRTLVWKRIG